MTDKKKSENISTIRQDSNKKPESKEIYKRGTDLMSKTTIKASSHFKKPLPPSIKSVSNQKKAPQAPI